MKNKINWISNLHHRHQYHQGQVRISNSKWKQNLQKIDELFWWIRTGCCVEEERGNQMSRGHCWSCLIVHILLPMILKIPIGIRLVNNDDLLMFEETLNERKKNEKSLIMSNNSRTLVYTQGDIDKQHGRNIMKYQQLQE